MRRVLIAIVVVALVAGGLWYWDQTRFPAAQSALANTPITLHEQEGGERDVFREGLRAGVAFLRTTGTPLTQAVEARLAHGDPCEPFLEPGGAQTGMAKHGWLCVDALAPGWRETVRARPAVAQSIVAHELAHVWQAQLGCLPDADAHEYLWIVEGTATAFGFWAVQAAGGIDDRGILAEIRRWGGNDPSLSRDLRRYEREGGGDAHYALWHLAVRELVRERGPKAVRDFCAAVGRGTPWRAAFAGAFGRSVDAFYAAFAPSAHRDG